MNNNIKEDYCSDEVNKLLKKEGFKVLTGSNYIFNEKENSSREQNYLWNYLDREYVYIISTQSSAIKWIRENFGIHIKIDWFLIEDNLIDWDYSIQKIGADIDEKGNSQYLRDYDPKSGFSSPEEAVNAALLCTLKNLIKLVQDGKK